MYTQAVELFRAIGASIADDLEAAELIIIKQF